MDFRAGSSRRSMNGSSRRCNADLAAPFVLRHGDRVRVFGEPVSLAFVADAEASPDPTDLGDASSAQCTIHLRLTPDDTAGETFALTASAPGSAPATAEVLGYHVSLHGLEPRPMRDGDPRPGQYVATIEIDRME
jgi:hypothetical protein